MYLSVISLPILGSIISGFFGRKVGVSGAQLITTLCITLTTVLAIIMFYEIGFNNMSVGLELFRWIDSESLNVLWSFNFDSLTVSMLIPVLIVSCLVHLYSVGYMSHDPHNQRFFSYLSLFTFMMIVLVTSNNLLLMFVGWEGVGICSYLLVSFWFTRIAANQSSISALLTNRVGDCFLTIGMFVVLWSFGNVDYYTIFSLSPFISENIITIIGICLLIGAMAKSSQVGLHVWLPMAMEGPTPVSALIHAATMVTAGVYLLMRNSPLIEYSETILVTCIWVGGITTVFSSLIGLFQQDIKKVIAYSTMSQLGMMVIAVGLSSYNIALFHLINHAFYKALLFLGAGSVIHAVSDNQDFRKYGGLIKFLPLTYSVMLIASLSLVAFPFMTGFYSKDLILESAYGHFYYSGTAIYYIATIGAMFTTLYSVKVLYITFISNPSGSIKSYQNAHESDIFMSVPLIILAIFSVFFGYIAKDIFIGLGSGFFTDNGVFIHPNHEIMLDTEFAVPLLYKLLPFMLTMSLTLISLLIHEFAVKNVVTFKLSNIGYNLFSFFNQRFYIELFYNKYITDVILKLGGQTTKVLDKGSIELIGPYGLETSLNTLSNGIATLDSGILTNYALYILLGLVSYMLIPNLPNNDFFVLIVFALFTSLYFRDDMKRKSNSVRLHVENGFNLRTLISSIFIGLIITICLALPIKAITYICPSENNYLLLAVIATISGLVSTIIKMELREKNLVTLSQLLVIGLFSFSAFTLLFYFITLSRDHISTVVGIFAIAISTLISSSNWCLNFVQIEYIMDGIEGKGIQNALFFNTNPEDEAGPSGTSQAGPSGASEARPSYTSEQIGPSRSEPKKGILVIAPEPKNYVPTIPVDAGPEIMSRSTSGASARVYENNLSSLPSKYNVNVDRELEQLWPEFKGANRNLREAYKRNAPQETVDSIKNQLQKMKNYASALVERRGNN